MSWITSAIMMELPLCAYYNKILFRHCRYETRATLERGREEERERERERERGRVRERERERDGKGE